jgi:hypothetical protein
MSDGMERYEILRCFGPEEITVELWDRTRAPVGLAFELISRNAGDAVLVGYDIEVPWNVVCRFLEEGRACLGIE